MVVVTGTNPELKTEDPDSNSESEKLPKISFHPANNEKFHKEEGTSKRICDLEEERLVALKQNQQKLASNNDTTPEEKEQAQQNVNKQKTL